MSAVGLLLLATDPAPVVREAVACGGLVLTVAATPAEAEFKLRQVLDILETKLVKRQVPLKALSRGVVEAAGGGRVRQRIELQQGIPIEKAREIVKLIKGTKRKVQAQIQEDQVRVFGRDKDELQAVIQFLREQELGIHTQFLNYRS